MSIFSYTGRDITYNLRNGFDFKSDFNTTCCKSITQGMEVIVLKSTVFRVLFWAVLECSRLDETICRWLGFQLPCY